jgi:hypothetical protein
MSTNSELIAGQLMAALDAQRVWGAVLVNIRVLGAKGNGISDDTKAIQAAVNLVGSSGGGTVYFPSGTYIVSSTIDLKSNVDLIFAKGATIKISNSCTGFYSMFSIKSVENVTISGMTYDGNYDRATYDISNNPEIAVYVVDSQNVRITDNVFTTCGIWTISCEVSAELPYNDNIYIERNIINFRVGKNSKPVQPNGFSVDTTQMYVDAKNYWVRENIISTDYTNAETAIEAHRRNGTVSKNIIIGFKNGVLIVPGQFAEDNDSAKTNISDNILYSVTNGVTLWQLPERDLENVRIHNNSIELDPARFILPTASKGITILDTLATDNSGKKVKNVHVSNNLITFKPFTTAFTDDNNVLNFVGISIRGQVSIENIKINDNTIVSAPATGIVVGVLSSSTYPNTAIGITVEDNTIIDAGINTNIATQSYNPRCAIRINGGSATNVEKAIVKNNKIIDRRTSGTYFTAPIYQAAVNSATCIIAENPISANGYKNVDLVDVSIDWQWDSQAGAPTLTKVAKAIKREGYVKLYSTIQVANSSGLTAGFGSFIVLPFTPTETRDVPITVKNTNLTFNPAWYLGLVAGQNIAYIYGTKDDNTIVTITKNDIKNGTTVSIGCEYLI